MNQDSSELEAFLASMQVVLGQQLYRIIELETMVKVRNEELQTLKNTDSKKEN